MANNYTTTQLRNLTTEIVKAYVATQRNRLGDTLVALRDRLRDAEIVTAEVVDAEVTAAEVTAAEVTAAELVTAAEVTAAEFPQCPEKAPLLRGTIKYREFPEPETK